ncbi:ABC transporter permease [Brachybacterium sp. EE-P12]|uniref:ABC transporter permease n=1 Tax=Candidatus Brachybacterium intestinipullorum TaxID=2838512 RepID=A0A9D2PX86_9MICO|nr:ABC transporter permease [Brachybacterium sp. EE-P12]HJC68059.1 ABC transporter permease [Candidatus Brachybacterium intestinipullorum]
MSGAAVANEFAKMRRLRVWLIAVLMTLAVLGLSLFTVVSSPDFDPGSPGAWNALLAGMSLGIPLICPLLLAVIASRLTEVEHTGNGWLSQATAGITPGVMCRAKLVALGLVVTVTTLGTGLLVILSGKLLVGILAPPPLGRWTVFTLCMLAVNLVVLALHLLVSAKVENQLVALGIGVLGCVLAVFSQGLPTAAAHVTPWGYYALATAADYGGGGYIAVDVCYPSIIALAVVIGIAFALVTDRFDRQEA